MPDADRVFAVSWMGADVSMAVHIGGTSLDLWGHRAAPYWIALAFVLALAGLVADGFRGESHVE